MNEKEYWKEKARHHYRTALLEAAVMLEHACTNEEDFCKYQDKASCFNCKLAKKLRISAGEEE